MAQFFFKLSVLVIASILLILARTVEFRKYSMMDSLGASTSAELIRFALKYNIADS